MFLKLCPVIPANAGIHNHRYLLNGFDRDRFIASAAFGFLSALPASGLFGRQASLGRPSFVLPSWTERPLLIATESLAAPAAALRQERSVIDDHDLRSDDFRFAPDSGHRRPARPCPKGAINRHRPRRRKVLKPLMRTSIFQCIRDGRRNVRQSECKFLRFPQDLIRARL